MNLLTAPTSLGNRPYETDGTARWTDRGPAILRDTLQPRLPVRALGNIPAAPYRDFVRAPGTIRNEDLVVRHVGEIAKALEPHDDFTLILGGDCSVLLGSLRGLRRGRELGLVFIDGHSDFNTLETTQTGAVAGMDLALVTGRGPAPLAERLVRDEHVVTYGIRDGDVHGSGIRSATSADEALAQLDGLPFFIHLDVDALDPRFMPYVDSPEPGGLNPETLVVFLQPLVRHPNAIGMEVTIYDPHEDHEGHGAALLGDVIVGAFANGVQATRLP
ncbi:MAG: arginase family protein [Thermoanaerobaculia bacterium]